MTSEKSFTESSTKKLSIKIKEKSCFAGINNLFHYNDLNIPQQATQKRLIGSHIPALPVYVLVGLRSATHS